MSHTDQHTHTYLLFKVTQTVGNPPVVIYFHCARHMRRIGDKVNLVARIQLVVVARDEGLALAGHADNLDVQVRKHGPVAVQPGVTTIEASPELPVGKGEMVSRIPTFAKMDVTSLI